jgi:hypothetical protein
MPSRGHKLGAPNTNQLIMMSEGVEYTGRDRAPPLPAALVRRGDRRLLHRPRRQRAVSVVRDFETGGGLNQERVWRIMVDVTRLVCGEATDGFGWSCV